MNKATPLQWPDDLHPEWMNVLRRLQSVGHTQNGITVTTLRVILDEHGKPIKWTTPESISLEPKRNTDEFLELLTRYLG